MKPPSSSSSPFPPPLSQFTFPSSPAQNGVSGGCKSEAFSHPLGHNTLHLVPLKIKTIPGTFVQTLGLIFVGLAYKRKWLQTGSGLCIVNVHYRVSWLWCLEDPPAQVTENMAAVQTRSCQSPQGNMERGAWEFFCLEWLFHSGLEQCTLSTGGKILPNVRIHSGRFLTPSLGTIYACSTFSTFFCLFTSYKTWSLLGDFPLLTVLHLKLRCHLGNCILGSFPFSGLGPHVECRRSHCAGQLEVLSDTLTISHGLEAHICSYSYL